MNLLVAAVMSVIITWCKFDKSMLWNTADDSDLDSNKHTDSY